MRRGAPSAGACRRLLAALAEAPPLEALRRPLQGERLGLSASWRVAYDPLPLPAELGWVRDLDLARAHEEVDAAVALLDEPGAAARRPGPSPWPVRTYFPATTWAACSTGKLFEDFERTKEARRFTHLALLLRLHCLETGAYPAALGPAPDGADLVYRVVDGGFELSLPGRPDLHLRVTR